MGGGTTCIHVLRDAVSLFLDVTECVRVWSTKVTFLFLLFH